MVSVIRRIFDQVLTGIDDRTGVSSDTGRDTGVVDTSTLLVRTLLGRGGSDHGGGEENALHFGKSDWTVWWSAVAGENECMAQ